MLLKKVIISKCTESAQRVEAGSLSLQPNIQQHNIRILPSKLHFSLPTLTTRLTMTR